MYLSLYSQLCCSSHALYSLSPSSGTSYNAPLNILAWLGDLSLIVEKLFRWVCPARDSPPVLGLMHGLSLEVAPLNLKEKNSRRSGIFRNSATLMLVVPPHLPSCTHPSCFPPYFFLLFSSPLSPYYITLQGKPHAQESLANTTQMPYFLWVLFFCFNSFLLLTFLFICMLWFLLFVLFFTEWERELGE